MQRASLSPRTQKRLWLTTKWAAVSPSQSVTCSLLCVNCAWILNIPWTAGPMLNCCAPSDHSQQHEWITRGEPLMTQVAKVRFLQIRRPVAIGQRFGHLIHLAKDWGCGSRTTPPRSRSMGDSGERLARGVSVLSLVQYLHCTRRTTPRIKDMNRMHAERLELGQGSSRDPQPLRRRSSPHFPPGRIVIANETSAGQQRKLRHCN
jgi:hypothetical protein